MKTLRQLARLLPVFLILILASTSDARIGGGGSSGSRGSRGFSPRSSRPYNSSPSYNYRANPSNPQPAPGFPSQNSGRSSFMRNMLGGVAGGFLGSMLFRGMGYGGGMGMPGSGGIGFLEILILAGLLFYLYRTFANRKAANNTYNSGRFFEKPTQLRSDPTEFDSNYSRPQSNGSSEYSTEEDWAQTLQQTQPNFDLRRFKEERTDEFLTIQSAWNRRDLDPVQNLIASELKESLTSDISDLKRSRHINKLENIAVRESELTEAWQEEDKEYATLKFRAQLLDYTINEDTQTVVSGDRNHTVKFQEEWTFVRDLRNGASPHSSPWKLTAISNQ